MGRHENKVSLSVASSEPRRRSARDPSFRTSLVKRRVPGQVRPPPFDWNLWQVHGTALHHRDRVKSVFALTQGTPDPGLHRSLNVATAKEEEGRSDLSTAGTIFRWATASL